MNPKRKDPCPCGSGKRYKHCCGLVTAPKAPSSADSLFAQAQAAHAAGQLSLAEAGYRQALMLDPQHAGATHYLGMLALAVGDHDRAQTLIEQSLRLESKDADFWSNLALLHEMRQDWAGARAAYEKSLAIFPAHAQRTYRLASVLRQLGQIDQAVDYYRQTLKLAPLLWPAWLDLGSALLKQDPTALKEAAACFRKAIELAPDRAEGYNALGVALISQEHGEEARKTLERAVQLDPAMAVAWYNLARVCLIRDDIDRALEAYQKAIALAPDYEDFYQQTGQALQMKGKFDIAEQFYAKALELNPDSPIALARLIEYRKFRKLDDPLLVKARHMVDESTDEAAEAARLCFALGKIFDRMNEFELAFGYYARGNRIRKAECEKFSSQNLLFWREKFPRAVDEIIEQYSASRLAELKAWGHPSERPILIVGMPRSGTTLTEQIIAAHPRVAGGGEREFWSRTADRLREGKIALNQAGLADIAQSCLNELDRVPGAKTAARVTDKMPHNFVSLGLIHATFPNACIFHVRRNPVDTCLSIFFQNFNCLHSYSFDMQDLVSHYREYQRLMAHWASVLPADRFFEFDYEDLVADQEGMSRKIIEFCGLEWDDACLRYYAADRAVKTPSLHQVRQKIYTSSVERWRNYEPYIAPLLTLLPDA